METLSQNKTKKREPRQPIDRKSRTKEKKATDLTPGKSLEQIRQEALMKLREMGLFF